MGTRKLHTRILYIGVALTVFFFVIDLNLPLGVAGGVPYVAVVLLSLWMPKPRHTIIAAVAGAALVLLGWALSPSGSSSTWIVATNRFLAIFGIGIAAFFILRYKKSELALIDSREQLSEMNNELEKRVLTRTKQLRESQELFQAISRNYPNGTINVLDKWLKYVFVEGKELFKLGVSSEQLIGTGYYDRLPHEVRDEIRQNLLRVFDGASVSFEVSIDDETYALNAVPLNRGSDEIEQALVVELNITKQKKAEEGIKKALEHERDVNELKSRFVSMASHEFRTPLSAVLSSVSLLEEYKSPGDAEKREKHINRIKSAIHNMTNILNDFLSLDRIEAGQMKSNPEEFDITALTGSVIEQLTATAKKGQRMLYDHIGGTGTVKVDRQMMKNIIINLLSNAIKYSGEGKVIKVTSVIEDGHLKMHFEDQGIGIPEKDRPYMFERFFRAGNATNIDGTGLGLNIVSKYLYLMRGSVSFSSAENQGSIFNVKVPCH